MNIRGFLFVFFSCFCTFSVIAQKQTSTVAENDLNFYLSYTNPDFFASSDSVLMRKNLEKYYSLYSYLYSEALLNNDDEKYLNTLDSLVLFMKRRYIAEKVLKEKTENNIISKEEVLDFYKTHSSDYTLPALCSYYQIFILKEDNETIQHAKKKVLELAALPDSVRSFKGSKNESFAVSYEQDVKLMQGYAISPFVENLKPKQFSELLNVPGFNTKVMYYVVSRTDKRLKPFEEVAEECRNRLRVEKSTIMMENLYSEALKRFSIPE